MEAVASIRSVFAFHFVFVFVKISTRFRFFLQFELKAVLEHMNVKVTDSDIFQMIADVDEDNSGAIGSSFLHTCFFFIYIMRAKVR